MLDGAGGIESDFTVNMRGENEFYLMMPGATGQKDHDMLCDIARNFGKEWEREVGVGEKRAIVCSPNKFRCDSFYSSLFSSTTLSPYSLQ